MFKRLTPFIDYNTVQTGIDFFQENLGFKIIYSEGDPVSMAIAERDNVQLFLQTHKSDGKPFEPAYRIEVEDIEQLYEEITDRGREILHPNTNGISKMPWGAKEFAVLDPVANTCITFYEHKIN